MRNGSCILPIVLTFATGAQAVRPRALTPREKARIYRRRAFGKGAIARAAGHAGFNQLRNSPHQWGRGAAGFVKRFGSSFGQHAIGETIGFGVGALRHEDPRYYRAGSTRVWDRLGHAVKSTFVARKDNGRKTVAAGNLSGRVGAAMVAQTWQPGGFALGSGLASGGVAVGGLAAANVVREFCPDIGRHVHRRHRR